MYSLKHQLAEPLNVKQMLLSTGQMNSCTHFLHIFQTPAIPLGCVHTLRMLLVESLWLQVMTSLMYSTTTWFKKPSYLPSIDQLIILRCEPSVEFDVFCPFRQYFGNLQQDQGNQCVLRKPALSVRIANYLPHKALVQIEFEHGTLKVTGTDVATAPL